MGLLETRAMKSASRPKLVFAGDIVGYDGVMGLMPYIRKVRMHRELTATQVSPKSITRFEPIQELEILRLLKRLHQDPNSQNLPDHLNQVSGSIMLRILYDSPNRNDHIVMEEFSQATTPGACMHLLQNVQDPYQYVKGQMVNGKDHVSYVAGLIKDIHRKIDPDEESVIAWTTASMMNAGTDTTGATLLAFTVRSCVWVREEVVSGVLDRGSDFACADVGGF
ncbi:O-methylsterigmatocystin oxidoreductase [Fusarium agapanthi]|uniref:O-methylsterigmatocystin oxidoreductase n=1 Tax=Fusarium agapanthi TaxID=1803897 RepID=A0A9P5B6X2_9HYPO|nr:O-methylsterigmatocystin oxidoreductase [Fusarium agapanthi]